MPGSHAPFLSSLVGRETRCLLEPNPDQRGSGGGGGRIFRGGSGAEGEAGTGAGAGCLVLYAE
jgi:hypothetical protein